ncbi:molybdenum cofactor biosynthesis protein MoaE, partial [Novosphingobium sp.]
MNAALSDVRLLTGWLDAPSELGAFTAKYPEAGGVVSFLGQVRAGDGVEALELRHYAPLTLPAMKELAARVRERWTLAGLLIVHRSGMMVPGEPIVLVAAA